MKIVILAGKDEAHRYVILTGRDAQAAHPTTPRPRPEPRPRRWRRGGKSKAKEVGS